MHRIQQKSCRVAIWSILAMLLFLTGVAYVEQLLPELETQTQDEQALGELVYALKTDGVATESLPVPELTFILPDHSSGAFLPRQIGGVRLAKPPVLDLYQRLSTYRI